MSSPAEGGAAGIQKARQGEICQTHISLKFFYPVFTGKLPLLNKNLLEMGDAGRCVAGVFLVYFSGRIHCFCIPGLLFGTTERFRARGKEPDCRILYEYAMFVELVRRRLREIRGNPEEAVDMAVRESIKKGILADFLKKHRAEVEDVILTEYDQEAHIRNEKNESWEEGRQEGFQEGERSVIRQLVLYHKREGRSPEEIVEILQNSLQLSKKEAEEYCRRPERDFQAEEQE